jgi:putative membrane protein
MTMKGRNAGWIIGLVVVAAVVLGLLAVALVWGAGHYYTFGAPMIGMHRAPMGRYGFGGGILTLLIWVVIIVGAVLLGIGISRLVRRDRLMTGPAEPAETPVEILKRRYAQGQINREDFQRMREELTGE